MSEPVRLAVAGAGLIGRRHVEAIGRESGAVLSAVVDPAPAGRAYAEEIGAPWFADLGALFAAEKPDGVILATPNQLHVEHGLACVAAGVPALVEKPIAVEAAAAERLVDAAEQAGAPLLVGHHRRHNPLIAEARKTIESGALGRIVAVHGQFWLMKPEEYFEVDWRRAPGAGPVFLNLIHDIDLLRFLVGEIVSVQAWESSAARGFEVEDTAAILLRFENGALGTVSISDTVVAPWSWELTAKENPAYPPTEEACYLIGGTHGSLELPNLGLWRNPEKRGWWEPIDREAISAPSEDPLDRQIRQFRAVIRGEEAPVASGREGLNTLRVVEAVKRSAASGARVDL